MNSWICKAVVSFLLCLSILPAISQAPYKVYYKKYPPVKKPLGKTFSGKATFYGKKYFGRITASGERLKNATCAHKTLPYGSMVEVTNLKNGRKTIVKVIDRGPFGKNREIDLSYDAAKKLDMVQDGIVQVNLKVVGVNGIVLLQPSKYLLKPNASFTARADEVVSRARY